MPTTPREAVVRARDALAASPAFHPDVGRVAAKALAEASIPGRLGALVTQIAVRLDGKIDPDIPPETVTAILLAAIDGVHDALTEVAPLDDPSIDAHLQGLRALDPIPGWSSEPSPAPEATEAPPLVGLSPEGRPSRELVAAFEIEAHELLATCEERLLGLEADPSDNGALLEVFRALHSLKGNCGFLGFAEMERLAHASETLLVDLKEGRCPVDKRVIGRLIAAVDALGRAATVAADGAPIPDLEAQIAAVESAPSLVVAAPPPSAAEPTPPTPEVEVQESTPQARAGGGTLRVDVSKVDQLLDLVGELIITGTAFRHLPTAVETGEALTRAQGQLERVIRSLQDVAMSLRMVPVAPTFRRMVRLVRDVSQRLGKPVDLEIEGEDAEIDKTVAELLADPLVHLVRNAIDHGIESPEGRIAAKKAKMGRVKLSASHVGGEVWIRVEDDGRGLDRNKIAERAVSRGLVDADTVARMSDADVFSFVFEPGFSTAEKVTDVSGRGVGLDVVRKNLELVKGRVDIRTVPGAGTTFTLRIPLTLAIIEGMLVRVGAETFTVPLLCIRESVVIRPPDVTVLSTGQEVVRIRGELLPVLRMHRLYGIQPDAEDLHRGILVVVEDGDRPLCLFVDQLIGQRQTVIKAVPGYLGTVRGIAGCTVLGDGKISLILDVGALVEHSVTAAA